MSPDSPALPSPNGTPKPAKKDLSAQKRHDKICDEFEAEWKAGKQPQLAHFLAREPGSQHQANLFAELLRVERDYRIEKREHPTADDYCARFPEFAKCVGEVFEETSALAPKSDSRSTGARFKPGDQINGRYLIVSLLGKGGMGEVYQAEDNDLRETVALKFLPPERTTDPAWVERLKQEVTLARSVGHPHVCQVHDYEEANVDEGRVSFLVMAYAAGGSLLRQANLRPSGRFPPEDVNVYARQLCDALDAVHETGVLHRDLKPGNVLLDDRGRVKLADFGLAAIAEHLLPENATEGTWLYMAPEQLDGKMPDRRSDLFALGLILYELLTGERPFGANTRAELRERQRTLPLAPSALIPNLDPAFDHAILGCLLEDPDKRPASAQEVKEKLPPPSREQIVRGGPEIKLEPKWALRMLAAGLLGLVLHAVLADSTMAFRQLPPARDPAWLRHEAVKVLGPIPSQGRGKAEHTGFEWDLDLVKHASFNDPAAWHPAAESRSPLVYFWYRSGPEHHAPSNRFAPTDPPLVTPGMECALFDLEGHLIEYHVVPPRKPAEPDARPLNERRTDHETKLLTAAGLKVSDFHRTKPHYHPPVFADDLWGLEEKGGTGKWVDVAVCGGQVVYFRVGEPFGEAKGRPDRAQGENVEAQGQRRLAGGFVTIGIVLLAVTAAGWPAYRNWQRGRADVSGALRVLALYAVCNTLSWLFITSHVPSLHVERVLLANSLGVTAFWGGVLFVCYLAIEPYMRQRWPERLSSWSRLLSGKRSDPLVGRDVLIGVLVGVCLSLPVKFAAAALGTYYLLAPVYDPLTPNVPAGLLFALVSFALIRTAGAFVLLFVLGLVFRKEWVAASFAVIAMTAGVVQSVATFQEKSVVTWCIMLLVAGMIVFTMRQWGWIATFVALFVSGTINIMPLTLSPHAWYAPTTIITAAVLVGLAVYGCVVSVGGGRGFSASKA